MTVDILRAQVELLRKSHIRHKQMEFHHAEEAKRVASRLLAAEYRLRNALELERDACLSSPEPSCSSPSPPPDTP